MLNEITGDATCNFNFHLSSTLSQNKLKSLLNNTKSNTTNSTSNDSQPLTAVPESADKCLDSKNLLVTVSSNGADNLSWKFFEDVDTLDHQLRSDESSPPPLLLNGGTLSSATSTIADTHDVTATTRTTTMSLLGMPHGTNYNSSTLPSSQPLSLGNNRKSNGYAINGTLLQPTEILSQTNATPATTLLPTVVTGPNTGTDLNNTALIRPIPQQLQQQQQLQHTEGTFVFTSPTSTFKRKKQQQIQRAEQEEFQQQQHHFEELHNNNLLKNGASNCYGTERLVGTSESAITLNEDYSNTANSKGSNTTLLRQLAQPHHYHQQQQQQHQQQQPLQHQQHHYQPRSNNTNDTKTVINTSTGVIITDTVVTYASSSTSSLVVGGNGSSTGNGNGTTTTRSTRTHTLPLITKAATTAATTASKLQLPSTFIADGVVDLVHDTKCASGKTPLKSKTKTSSKRRNNNGNHTSRHTSTAAKMQASSSGGSGTTTTAKGFSNSSLVDDIEMHLGLIGWRKKCLYTLLVLLMLLIIVNLGLTLWILKVMEFSTEGMGQLKIVPGGIQLSGQALIMDMLRASSIRSRHGQPISIESSRNFSINTRGTDGLLENHLFLGHDKLECMATSFRINDTNGRNLFSVNRDEVTIGAHALRIDGEGGAIFRESIQTPHVRAEPGRELRLESPTRQLEMKAAQEINLQSRAGGIDITALEDIKLSTLEGSLRFESSKIFMPNLRTVQLPQPGTPQSPHSHRIFQVCACANGKLFLAASHFACAGDDSTVCR